jgi:hypothetical protein
MSGGEDGFEHRGPFHRSLAIAVVDLAILLKKGDIVNRGFDAQDQAEFVVHFDGDSPHLVFDPAAKMAKVKAITQLILVVAMQLTPQKGGDVRRFDGVNKGFQEMRIKGLHLRLALKDQIGGKFSLHNRPAIGQVEALDHRAVTLNQLIQLGVQLVGIESSRQLIGQVKVGDVILVKVTNCDFDELT